MSYIYQVKDLYMNFIVKKAQSHLIVDPFCSKRRRIVNNLLKRHEAARVSLQSRQRKGGNPCWKQNEALASF